MTTLEEKNFYNYFTDIMALMEEPNEKERNKKVREKMFLAGATLYNSKYILDPSYKSSIDYLKCVQKEIRGKE